MSECKRCQAAEERAERHKQDALDWQAQCQALMRQKRYLEAELAPQKAGPNDRAIKRIFEYWVERTGRDPKRTKLTDDRVKAVKGALKHYEVGRILMAIDGAALGPYIDEKGTVFNDITLICRGSKIEDFERKAEDPVRMLTRQIGRLSKVVASYRAGQAAGKVERRAERAEQLRREAA